MFCTLSFRLTICELSSRQIQAIWNDTSTPFRTFTTGVTWKDIKTLQLGMPDIHESLMVSLFAPSTSWKSGWLNDSVSDFTDY